MLDQEAANGLGIACHDIIGRILVAHGEGGPAQPIFDSALDLSSAGVLCALPALISNGLFIHAHKHLNQPIGYYSLDSLLLLFAFLVLARVPSLEKMRYLAPGEWGRMLGLDRIPEVKTARRKIDEMIPDSIAEAWAREMATFWMQLDEDLAGVLYVDGHVRTYSGDQTKLPARFSSRNRLCLRSLMDYWVSDKQGTPFFVVTAVGTEGMLHHIRTTIIPRLLEDVPAQPTPEELDADPRLHRFILVFDREGWSPEFFAELWREHRIAILTYHKGPNPPWPEEEFTEKEVPTVFGNTTKMDLAERPFFHKACSVSKTKAAVDLREIRRSCANKTHQTAIITTIKTAHIKSIAHHMFSRWSQENFFKYGTRELGIDRLCGYEMADPPNDQKIRNPEYATLDAALRRNLAGKKKLEAQRGRMTLSSNDSQAVADYLEKTSKLTEQLEEHSCIREELLAKRKNIPKNIKLSELPEDKRPRLIAPARTQFFNTIRIIAYRAETALVSLIRQTHSRHDDARALAKNLFTQDADLLFDPQTRTLTIRVHHFTNPVSSRTIAAVLHELNQTKTDFPGTNIRLRYEMVSTPIPLSQEV